MKPLFLAALLALAPLAHADDAVWAKLKAGGNVLLIRHASTESGLGDPPGFKLGDCTTQRNLNDEGRAQARRIGEWFSARGLKPARVRSSPWCRCLDTAALAFTIGLDFEGDQYTFYKFPLPDLQDLYGIEVQELNIWRPLLQQAQRRAGRLGRAGRSGRRRAGGGWRHRSR